MSLTSLQLQAIRPCTCLHQNREIPWARCH
nr:MAG TPA: hypothetical protein [Caudoviricetes sp.]